MYVYVCVFMYVYVIMYLFIYLLWKSYSKHTVGLNKVVKYNEI